MLESNCWFKTIKYESFLGQARTPEDCSIARILLQNNIWKETASFR